MARMSVKVSPASPDLLLPELKCNAVALLLTSALVTAALNIKTTDGASNTDSEADHERQ